LAGVYAPLAEFQSEGEFIFLELDDIDYGSVFLSALNKANLRPEAKEEMPGFFEGSF